MKILMICSFFWNSRKTPKNIGMILLGGRWLWFCVTLWIVKWERYYVVRYISIFADEVSIIDNTNWISVITLALGWRLKQGLAKMWAKNETRESHFMFPGGWEYERVGELNLHTPKWTRNLGVGLPMDSRIFGEWFQGSIPIGLGSFLYH
jgi:hypothetical protein